jgi:hypothetical protein
MYFNGLYQFIMVNGQNHFRGIVKVRNQFFKMSEMPKSQLKEAQDGLSHFQTYIRVLNLSLKNMILSMTRSK